ncbi:MAG: hypothetical protein Q8M44_03120, partial [bacterium]|nr:hypothetical protein [bacterium]
NQILYLDIFIFSSIFFSLIHSSSNSLSDDLSLSFNNIVIQFFKVILFFHCLSAKIISLALFIASSHKVIDTFASNQSSQETIFTLAHISLFVILFVNCLYSTTTQLSINFSISSKKSSILSSTYLV